MSDEVEDASTEGFIYRSLFHTDDDSSSDGDDNANDGYMNNSIGINGVNEKKIDLISFPASSLQVSESNSNALNDEEKTKTTIDDHVVRVRTLMETIQITEKTLPGIAERIWPAAEYLANFILNYVKHKGQIKITGCDHDNHTVVDNAVVSCIPPMICEKDETDRQQVMDSLYNIFANEINGTAKTDSAYLTNDAIDEDYIIPTLELGAGVGLTGIKLATELHLHCTLTDLECALPLLDNNIALNADKFLLGKDAVKACRLEWGTDDYMECLHFPPTQSQSSMSTQDYCSKARQSRRPLLIIAADCVYYEELHEPLEDTISSILSSSPVGSICLIAGVRRWKRDNTFYSRLGRRSRTASHELIVSKLYETIDRRNHGRKDVMSVYGIQWAKR